jgi:dTDP-4-dehydrorhamnose 3,5-epimerase
LKFIETGLEGVLLVEPDVWRDERGFFLETFHAKKYREGGIGYDFVQDNHSRSVRGTLRGLHAQRRHPQGKLVRCIQGEIWDVAVDLRPDSKTFARWYGAELSGTNFKQIFVPPGFAHGFCVLSETAEVEYKCTALYDKEDEIGIVWNDPRLAIEWPLSSPVLSPRDAALPTLDALTKQLAQ